jgi:hypothetical protein
MTITLTGEEQSDLANQSKRDPTVIMTFFDWLARYQNDGYDQVTACRLALRRQEETFRQVYEDKVALYSRTLRKNPMLRALRFKNSRPAPRFLTKSGIRVRSKIEKTIADYLWDQRIRFVYEPILILNGFHVMPDFQLPDHDLLLEHFGLENESYRKTAAAKCERYVECGVRVICTYPADEPEIECVLARKLREHGVIVSAPVIESSGAVFHNASVSS